MFLEYFRLFEQPFGVTPDPRYLFPSAGHREALASLVYGIESNLGFGTLIAQPGMGKTTLLFHILEQYRQSARTAFIFNTQCDSRDLLRSILSELDDEPVPEQTFQLHERFKQILSRELQAHRRVIVVIDEAQNLGDIVMETVRLLSNFESAHSKLLHIILAGQPELAAKLRQPELSQLQQRIPILAGLPQFSSEETFSYIAHRLHIAGYRGRPLFTGQSMAEVARHSRGIPREINRICFNCLSLAYASSKTLVDLALVNEVVADLGFNGHVMKKKDEQVQEPPAAWRGFAPATTNSIQPPPSQGQAEPPTKRISKV
jgi:general secretion pathway protein A